MSKGKRRCLASFGSRSSEMISRSSEMISRPSEMISCSSEMISRLSEMISRELQANISETREKIVTAKKH